MLLLHTHSFSRRGRISLAWPAPPSSPPRSPEPGSAPQTGRPVPTGRAAPFSADRGQSTLGTKTRAEAEPAMTFTGPSSRADPAFPSKTSFNLRLQENAFQVPPDRTSSSPRELGIVIHSLSPCLSPSRPLPKSCAALTAENLQTFGDGSDRSPRGTVDRAQAQRTFSHPQLLNLSKVFRPRIK